MAPPPLSDLLDWRVPYVPVLAMICVSLEYACDALLDGLRAPPLTGVFSPAAIANGATQIASTMALAASQTALPWNLDMVPAFRSVPGPLQQARAPEVAVAIAFMSMRGWPAMAPSVPPRPLVTAVIRARSALLAAADRLIPAHIALFDKSLGVGRTHVLGAIAELGVIDELARGPATAAELAP